MLSNSVSGEPAEFSLLQAILAGVPRSYPFSGVWLHFYAPVFGERLIGLPKLGHSLPGVVVTDNWWVSGRKRALSVYTVVDAEAEDKKLAAQSGARRRRDQGSGQSPANGAGPHPAPGGDNGAIPPANAAAVKAIVAGYRASIGEVAERAAIPHALPPADELRLQNPGILAGPRKPALEAAFKPMGYGCRGGSGVSKLTRRTSGLTMELYLDVGTWSHEVTAMLIAQRGGIPRVAWNSGGAAALRPISHWRRAQWQKIVDNLAAMVRELERGFVPEIEQAAGPTPAWYRAPA